LPRRSSTNSTRRSTSRTTKALLLRSSMPALVSSEKTRATVSRVVETRLAMSAWCGIGEMTELTQDYLRTAEWQDLKGQIDALAG